MDDDLRSRYRLTPPTPAQLPAGGQVPSPRVTFPRPDQPQPAQPTSSTQNNPFIHAQSQSEPQLQPQSSLAFIPSQPIVKRRRFNRLTLSVLTLLILAGGGAGYYFGVIKHKSPKTEAAATAPIPADILNHATFSIYYPLPTPDHYAYQQGTASTVNGLFYFKLANGSKSVAFIEQNLPAKPPNLSSIPNFGKIDIPAGQAAVGTVAGQPTAIIIAKNTLINLSSSGNVSLTDIKDLVTELVPSNNASK